MPAWKEHNGHTGAQFFNTCLCNKPFFPFGMWTCICMKIKQTVFQYIFHWTEGDLRWTYNSHDISKNIMFLFHLSRLHVNSFNDQKSCWLEWSRSEPKHLLCVACKSYPCSMLTCTIDSHAHWGWNQKEGSHSHKFVMNVPKLCFKNYSNTFV